MRLFNFNSDIRVSNNLTLPKMLLFLLLSLEAVAEDFEASIVINGFNNVYAPYVFKHQATGAHQVTGSKVMYSGGWQTENDASDGIDKLFYCNLDSVDSCMNNLLEPIILE